MVEIGPQRELWVIGLMSGTSMDGIDGALIQTDGDTIYAFGANVFHSYDDEFRSRLSNIIGRVPDQAGSTVDVVNELTSRHTKVVKELLKKSQLKSSDIDLIGFHGHTVLHSPQTKTTCQVGDAKLLAKETGIPVVADFRLSYVAAGGEGAPLSPAYHVALSRGLERPLVILNIGGVANLTWISPDGGAIAFDTGPGNALIDKWVQSQKRGNYDKDGKLAKYGGVKSAILQSWMENPYFARSVPKSLDRDDFAPVVKDLFGVDIADGAATLTAFTAASVCSASAFLPASPVRWLVTGGGRRNPVLMAELQMRINTPVEPVEAVGWDGDALEAQAFAFLAARSAFAMPLTYPQTTGVLRPMSGGKFHSVE